MKKALCLLIAFALALPLFSCSVESPAAHTEPGTLPGTGASSETLPPAETKEARRVAHPMAERPNYVLHEGATADEMRETAIRAMRDELTVPWVTDTEITYLKSGSGDGKTFRYGTDETFAGLPYTNGGTSLFRWLENYDFETGRMIDLPNRDSFNSSFGNSCAASAMWGWNACTTSTVWHGTEDLLVASGAVRLGPYTYPDDLKNYLTLSTEEICRTNGEQIMYASYALLLPADCLTTSGNGNTGHVMMAISAANVVKTGGVIDGKESWVLVQEQRSGIFQTSPDFVKEEDGERLHYSGRTSAKFTFEELYKSHYLPHTCAEFLGQKEYEMPVVTLSGGAATLAELLQCGVKSNYDLCVLIADIYGAGGEYVLSRRTCSTFDDRKKLATLDFPVSRLPISAAALSRKLEKGKNYTLKLSCIDAAGAVHELAETPFVL